MLSRRQWMCSCICLMLLTSVLSADITTSTTKAPSKRYPVRTFLGNMYHRFRNNKTPGMILIPPLLRLAYQYGGPLLERMSSAFGLTGQAAAASAPIDNIVESAISGALGGAQAAGGAGAMGGMPFAGLPPGLGGFGAAPMGGFGGVRPVFFRRRRR